MATADDAVKITAGTVGRVNHFLKTKPLDSKGLHGIYGGWAGIRTLGRVTPSIDFESIPFDHSGTSSPLPTSTPLYPDLHSRIPLYPHVPTSVLLYPQVPTTMLFRSPFVSPCIHKSY